MKKYLLLLLLSLTAFAPVWADGANSEAMAVSNDEDDDSGNLSFTFGGAERPYQSQIRLYSVAEKREMTYYWQERYEPGEYVACLIGFRENGDVYYIASPSKSFKITSTSSKVVVDLPLAASDAYVDVPVRLINADASYDNFRIAEVSVVYDKMFEYTNINYAGNGDPEYYWFNKSFPMKMFKGEYDFSMPYIQLGSERVKAYNVTGHVSVKDASSTFDIDMKGKHLFSNIQAVDAQGNVIDWSEMGYAVYWFNIVDEQGKILFTTGSAAVLPEGDYNVVYRVQKYGESAKFFSGKLHVDAQSGNTAQVQLPEVTGITNAQVTRQSLKATALTGGLLIEGNDADVVKVAVYNLSGACILNTTAKSGEVVNLSTLPHASYVVRLTQAEKTVAQKFVK